MSSRRSASPGTIHGHHREAMVEVLPEPPLGDHRFQVLGRRRDDAHVDLDALGAPYPLELLVDEHAQDLLCVSRGMSATSSR